MADLLLEPSPDALDRRVNELIGSGDDREVMDRLGELRGVVDRMRSSRDEQFDVAVPIANVGAIAAVALRRGKAGLAGAALDALLATYLLGDVKADHASDKDVRLFEAIAGALWALGAVAVRGGDWEFVRKIAAVEPAQGGYYESWLRHGQVMSSRRATDPEDDNALNLALPRLGRHPSYAMSDDSDADRLRLLCIFDQLALLVVASGMEPGERVNYYPSYAKCPAEFVEGAVIDLRSSGAMRDAIFPQPDEHLRDVLRRVNESAIFQAAMMREAARGWEYSGFVDARTWAFILEGHTWEEWRIG